MNLNKLFQKHTFTAVILFCISIAVIAVAIHNSHKITVGVLNDNAPWHTESGDGFDIDMANALCKSMQKQCEFLYYDADIIEKELLQGNIDIAVSAYEDSIQKSSVIASEPYMDTGHVFTSIHYPRFSTLESFKENIKDSVIGVLGTNATINTVNRKFSNAPFKNLIVGYKSLQEMKMDLLADNIQIALAETSMMLYVKRNAKNLRVISPPLFHHNADMPKNHIVIIANKNKTRFLKNINKHLGYLQKNGTLQKLSTKWLGFDASVTQ